MPDVTGGGTIDGVGVTTITTYPEYATDTVEIRHEVSLGAQNNDDINIALAIDTSLSTADPRAPTSTETTMSTHSWKRK